VPTTSLDCIQFGYLSLATDVAAVLIKSSDIDLGPLSRKSGAVASQEERTLVVDNICSCGFCIHHLLLAVFFTCRSLGG